jgi:predicted XRE-type DNA-binding protein
MTKFQRQTSNQKVSSLFVVLTKTINTIGVDSTIEQLHSITSKSKSEMDDTLGNYIIEIVTEKVMGQNFVFQNTDKSRYDGQNQKVACLVSFFLKKHAKFSQTEIAEKIGRNKSQVSKYITKMSKLKPIGEDKNDDLCNLLEEVDLKIQKIIKKRKNIR